MALHNESQTVIFYTILLFFLVGQTAIVHSLSHYLSLSLSHSLSLYFYLYLCLFVPLFLSLPLSLYLSHSLFLLSLALSLPLFFFFYLFVLLLLYHSLFFLSLPGSLFLLKKISKWFSDSLSFSILHPEFNVYLNFWLKGFKWPHWV